MFATLERPRHSSLALSNPCPPFILIGKHCAFVLYVCKGLSLHIQAPPPLETSHARTLSLAFACMFVRSSARENGLWLVRWYFRGNFWSKGCASAETFMQCLPNIVTAKNVGKRTNTSYVALKMCSEQFHNIRHALSSKSWLSNPKYALRFGKRFTTKSYVCCAVCK